MGIDDERDEARPWHVRLGWLLLIWAAGVGALGALSYLIRHLMQLAGLTA